MNSDMPARALYHREERPPTDETPDFTVSHALIIGIDDYQNGIPPLRTAVNDATRLARILAQDYGYQVHLLTESVTRAALLKVLQQDLPPIIAENDRLLFYFAGHGVALDGDDGPVGYLVPRDGQGGAPDSCLAMQDLHDALVTLPCRHLLAVLDCCFAGTFRWATLRDTAWMPKIIHRERYLRYIRDPAWQVLTSAAYDQQALDIAVGGRALSARDDNRATHSPFALALFDALAGAADVNGDGLITATELYSYLREQVESHGESVQLRQTPGLWPLRKHDKGEYLFPVPGQALNLPPAPALTPDNNPYRGLQAFEEADQALFFGRAPQIETLAKQVQRHPLTVVTGASGTGKSSLVKAGVLPYLRAHSPVPLNDGEKTRHWHILPPWRPGDTPATGLAELLREQLSLTAPSLSVGLQAWQAQHPDTRLLLVIDQLEEVLTQCRDEDQRAQFFTQITALPPAIHLLCTLRADFEPQIAQYFPHWQAARFTVAPMTQNELRAVIEGPAQARVLYFEPAELVDTLINEVVQTPGALPLLSFTLSELYLSYLARHSDNRALTEADYQQLGGVIGALRHRANTEYQQLDAAHQATMQRILLRMIAVEGGELARRRVPRSELVYADDAENQRVEGILKRLIAVRLLVSDETHIEPAHDALVRAWDRLLEWRDAQEQALPLSVQRRLSQAAHDWELAERKKGLLWNSNPNLAVVGNEASEDWLNCNEREFVNKSIKLRKQRQWLLSGSITAVLIASLVASVFFYFQEQAALRLETKASGLAYIRTVEGARTAASRGDWQAAHDFYTNGIQDTPPDKNVLEAVVQRDAVNEPQLANTLKQDGGYPDKTRLEVERLRAFFSLGNRESLEKELETYYRQKDLAAYQPYAATITLFYGDFLMSDAARASEGFKLVTAALSDEDSLKKFNQADLYYAKGLVSNKYFEAINYYQQALAEAPFHHRANAALMTSYAFSGETEKAQNIADFMKRIFKQDPLPYFVESWIQLLGGEYEESFKTLSGQSDKIPRNKLDKLLKFLTVMSELLDALKAINESGSQPSMQQILSLSSQVLKLLPLAGDSVLTEFGLNLPTVRSLFESAVKIVNAYVKYAMPFGNKRQSIEQIKQITKHHPDAIFLSSYAMIKLIEDAQIKDTTAKLGALQNVSELFRQAVDRPSIVPWLANRSSRIYAMWLDALLFDQKYPSDRDLLTILEQDTYWLIAHANLTPTEKKELLPQIIKLLPEELARALLSHWRKEEPDIILAIKLSAKLEFRAKRYKTAIDFADAVLTKSEADAEMSTLREQAVLEIQGIFPPDNTQ